MIGGPIHWLMQDEQKELYDILFALTLNIVFLGLFALLLWPAGRTLLAWRLTKGYALFWVVVYVVLFVLFVCCRIFRLSVDSRFDAFVLANLAASGLPQTGWSAFAALTVHDFAHGVSWLGAAGLYFGGLLSSYVAFNIISAFYTGSIYRQINLPLALVSYLVFSVWPASGRVLFGWFFNRF